MQETLKCQITIVVLKCSAKTILGISWGIFMPDFKFTILKAAWSRKHICPHFLSQHPMQHKPLCNHEELCVVGAGFLTSSFHRVQQSALRYPCRYYRKAEESIKPHSETPFLPEGDVISIKLFFGRDLVLPGFLKFWLFATRCSFLESNMAIGPPCILTCHRAMFEGASCLY